MFWWGYSSKLTMTYFTCHCLQWRCCLLSTCTLSSAILKADINYSYAGIKVSHQPIRKQVCDAVGSIDKCLNRVLALNAPIATIVVRFSCLLKCLRSLYGYNVDPDQTAPIGAVCSGSRLFASILNSSDMLGDYLQQTTSAEDIFRCIFF